MWLKIQLSAVPKHENTVFFFCATSATIIIIIIILLPLKTIYVTKLRCCTHWSISGLDKVVSKANVIIYVTIVGNETVKILGISINSMLMCGNSESEAKHKNFFSFFLFFLNLMTSPVNHPIVGKWSNIRAFYVKILICARLLTVKRRNLVQIRWAAADNCEQKTLRRNMI